jgi:hypothetical protein
MEHHTCPGEGISTNPCIHTTYGLHFHQVTVPKVSSQNPRPETKAKTAQLQQLRLEMTEVIPGKLLYFQFETRFTVIFIVMQGRNFEFLQGYMPSFAEVQMVRPSFSYSIICQQICRKENCRNGNQCKKTF